MEQDQNSHDGIEDESASLIDEMPSLEISSLLHSNHAPTPKNKSPSSSPPVFQLSSWLQQQQFHIPHYIQLFVDHFVDEFKQTYKVDITTSSVTMNQLNTICTKYVRIYDELPSSTSPVVSLSTKLRDTPFIVSMTSAKYGFIINGSIIDDDDDDAEAADAVNQADEVLDSAIDSSRIALTDNGSMS
jgi:hypothetical protein